MDMHKDSSVFFFHQHFKGIKIEYNSDNMLKEAEWMSEY